MKVPPRPRGDWRNAASALHCHRRPAYSSEPIFADHRLMDLRTLSRRATALRWKSQSSVCRESPTHAADFAAKLAKTYEPTETSMPLLMWLSAFSYWRRVNAEMTRATLQFLDDVERLDSTHTRNALVLGEPARQFAGHEDVRSRRGDLHG
jgi:hypothetical protein